MRKVFRPCFSCDTPFWFDPDTVPSLAVTASGVPVAEGQRPARREAVCVVCVDAINLVRLAEGLPMLWAELGDRIRDGAA